MITDLLEALTIFCFGLSWPISIRKSIISRTAKGKSLFFEVFLLIGYAFGCFSTGYLVGKRNGMDIRSTGSGNIGTTNALRSMGAKAGAITFLGDLLKAFVPMLLVKYVYCAHMGYDPNQSVAYMYTLFTGLGVVLG